MESPQEAWELAAILSQHLLSLEGEAGQRRTCRYDFAELQLDVLLLSDVVCDCCRQPCVSVALDKPTVCDLFTCLCRGAHLLNADLDAITYEGEQCGEGHSHPAELMGGCVPHVHKHEAFIWTVSPLHVL